MEEPQGSHRIRTDVSFAGTKSFAAAFPNEVTTQNSNFMRPSWQQRFDDKKAEGATFAKLPDLDKNSSSSPKSRALTILAPHLENELLDKALKIALSLPKLTNDGKSSPRTDTLIALIPQLHSEARKQTLCVLSRRISWR